MDLFVAAAQTEQELSPASTSSKRRLRSATKADMSLQATPKKQKSKAPAPSDRTTRVKAEAIEAQEELVDGCASVGVIRCASVE
jgi:hypothetical protein